MKALSPRRRPLPTPQLPFLSFRTAFFMAPGGQAPSEGLPEPKLEWVQLPTVSNSRGAGALRPDRGRRGGPPGAARTPHPGRCPSGWPPGGRSWNNCAVTGPPGTRERGVSGNWGEGDKTCAGWGVGRGRIVHSWKTTAEDGRSTEEGAAEM